MSEAILDHEALADVVIETIKDSLTPLVARLIALEKREPLNGRDGLPGVPGPGGKDGRDGKDAVVTSELIERLAISPLENRIELLEARAAIPGPPGDASERGAPGDKGDRGEAGRDADRAELDALKAQIVVLQANADHDRTAFNERVQMVVSESLAKLPTPVDGKDGTSVAVDDVLPILRAEVQQAVAALPSATNGRDGHDGRSVTLEELTPVIRAEVQQTIAALPAAKDGQDGHHGADGRDGADGRAVTIDELQPVIAQAVEQTVATWPKPKDGTSVTVDDVAPLIASSVAKAFDEMPKPLDGLGIKSALIDTNGHLHISLTNGETNDLGRVVGASGRDGLPGVPGRWGDKGEPGQDGKNGRDGTLEGVEVVQVDDRTWALVRSKDSSQLGLIHLSHPLDRGVYKDAMQYERGDAVTWRRSIWIAQEDTAAMPDTGAAGARPWRLAVPAARDGKDGKPGPKGETGADGRTGRDLTQLGRDGQKW